MALPPMASGGGTCPYLIICLFLVFIRRTQYCDFVEVFNCWTVLESNFVIMTVFRVLKVPFKKAAPLCPIDVPEPLVLIICGQL